MVHVTSDLGQNDYDLLRLEEWETQCLMAEVAPNPNSKPDANSDFNSALTLTLVTFNPNWRQGSGMHLS